MKHADDIINIVSKTLNIETAKIELDSEVEYIPNWDSLSALRVMTAIEREFSIRIPLFKFLKIKKIDDLVRLISVEQ